MVNGVWIGTCIIGACVLLPYNTILQVQPYFDLHAFPDMSFSFTSMICYSAPLSASQAVLTLVGDRFTVKGRMVFTNVGTTVVCAGFMLITILAYLFEAPTTLYCLCLACILALSVMNSIMQTALLGLAGRMGQEYSGAAMLGFGVCGVMIFALSLLLEVVIPGGSNDTATSAWRAFTLFVFCLLYTVISSWTFHFYLCRLPAAAEALRAMEAKRSSVRPEARELRAEEGGNSTAQGTSTWQRVAPVLRAIAPQAFNVWLVFAVTMTIFPGVMLNWKPGPNSAFANNRDLFFLLLTGAFQAFDVCGRYLAEAMAKCKCVSPRGLWIFPVLRLLFVPAFILGQRLPDNAVWGSDVVRFLLISLMSLSNGLCGCWAMMFGPDCCKTDEKEVAGIAMSFTMVTGIFSGTLLAFLTQL